MLTVTSSASRAIVHLLSAQGIHKDDGGLHVTLSRSGDKVKLIVEITAHPTPGEDIIIDAAGTQVFLDRETRIRLADTILDATSTADGRPVFLVESPADHSSVSARCPIGTR
jgi:Fe-S cluster assembly iron-binding protein IscA